jgi:hypothetical protein
MLIIGCDYHPSFQQIAFVDTETGECGERKLTHKEEAESFYRDLKGCTLRVGREATWHARWFERLLAELNFELWIGDPAEIRAKRVRKQKNDRLDAEHLLQLLVEDRISADLGTESGKPRSAATALAPAPAAGDCPERRNTTQERIVEQAESSTTSVALVGSVECAATARFTGAAGPTQPEDRRTEHSD